MPYSLRLFVRDPWIGFSLLGALIVQTVVWWYVTSRLGQVSDQAILHYNMVFGVDLIGSKWQLIRLPAGGLLILTVNALVSWLSYRGDRFWSRFAIFFAAILQVPLAVAIYGIMGLNI